MSARQTLVSTLIAVILAGCGSGPTSAPGASREAGAAPASAAGSSMPSFAQPTAVGGAQPSAGGAGAPDVASLVTADMATSIIGGSPTMVTPPISIVGVSVASYETTGGSVTVYVQQVAASAGKTQLEAAVAMAGAERGMQPVNGIGDAAGEVVDSQTATVAFVKHGTLVAITGHAGDSTGIDLEPKVVSVAKEVAGRL